MDLKLFNKNTNAIEIDIEMQFFLLRCFSFRSQGKVTLAALVELVVAQKRMKADTKKKGKQIARIPFGRQ